MAKIDELITAITADKELMSVVMQHTWVSGSQTDVYPIEISLNGYLPRIDIQLNIKVKRAKASRSFYKKDERMLKGIGERYKSQHGKLVEGYSLSTLDGSCPPTLILWLKKQNL